MKQFKTICHNRCTINGTIAGSFILGKTYFIEKNLYGYKLLDSISPRKEICDIPNDEILEFYFYTQDQMRNIKLHNLLA